MSTVTNKVTKNVSKDRWIASLSNGETIFEDKFKNTLSAWKRLGTYVKENKLAITNMRLQIGGRHVELPSHQEGYIINGKACSTGAWSRMSVCIGYAQGGLAMIHEVSADGASHTVYCDDPGEPFTIYRHDIGD
jgi:hypothetical protein